MSCYSPCQKKPKKKPSRFELFLERLNDLWEYNALFQIFVIFVIFLLVALIVFPIALRTC